MKKILIYILVIVITFSFCSCGANEASSEKSTAISGNKSDKSATDKSDTEELKYPYVDTEGRTRYQLYINGKLVKTQHDPYTYASEPKGAYYPIVEVLDYLGVVCLFDENVKTLTTKINGKVITCSADNKDITVGKKTLSGTAPEYIEDCFFVPSYTFMELLDAVVDFNSDRSGVTITTGMMIDAAISGTQGLTISAETANKMGEKLYSGSEACQSCGGTSKSICTRCSGTGNVTQYIQSRNAATGQMTVQSTKTSCSSCAGSGRTTCHSCGGTGKH